MTRFARAKGSKSCNERAPEDSTPWGLMKDQLLKAKHESDEAERRKEAEKQRVENYENFLKERKVQKRQATWCDFPEDKQNKVKLLENALQNGAQPSKKYKKKLENASVASACNPASELKTNSNEVTTQKDKNKPKVLSQLPQTENDQSQAPERTLPSTKKQKTKRKLIPDPIATSATTVQNNKVELVKGPLNQDESDLTKKQKKSKKRNKNKETKADSVTNNDILVDDNIIVNEYVNNKNKAPNKQINALMKKKEKKLVDGKPQRRKEINDRSFQLVLGGKDVELVRYDGFPVMKKDAVRLEELKNGMIKKGIPKSEVQRTMKLERRRAEKALARLKRDVCYNCRKGGHNLSDCPDLKSKIPGSDAAEGVCFKCGSTEHRQFECKVQKDNEFRFATCFICKEPGHIARQCPDNPKGLYPNGGGCKLCGDVTHLRKDCPTVKDKTEGSSMKLHTFESSANIEDIGQVQTSTCVESSKKPRKIKF